MSAPSPGKGVQAHIRCAAARCSVQIQLLTPLVAPGGETHGDGRNELAQSVIARGELRQRTSGRDRQVRSENGARRLIGHAHRQRAVHRQHARWTVSRE